MWLPPAFKVLGPGSFNGLIEAYGSRFLWKQAHLCPCTWNGEEWGSPDPQCQTCSAMTGVAIGYYYDAPVGPFQGLVTFIHTSPTPDEPGAIMDEKVGLVQRAEPAFTIPSTETAPWTGASINDIFVEIDAIDRFDASLTVGSKTIIPYQNQVSVAPSGAVTIYDTTNHILVPVSGYVVSGTTNGSTSVLLPSGYGAGTSYIVEFTAAKSYVAWRVAGSVAHSRPFAQLAEPKRFRLQTLDLWLRARS